jgi:hypothetical protein
MGTTQRRKNAPLAPHSLDGLSRRSYVRLATALRSKKRDAHQFFALFVIDSRREHRELLYGEHDWLIVAWSIELQNYLAFSWKFGSDVF